MKLVVSNTGPVLHLWEAQALDLLRGTGEVHIPEDVNTELSPHLAHWQTQRPGWISVDLLEPLFRVRATAWLQAGLLDPGEAEAVALSQQVNADWLLTDDAAARLFA